MCGQGEWHTQKHGEKHRKRWKKLHIGVDSEGWSIAWTMTDSHEQDPSQIPALLAQVDQELGHFIDVGIGLAPHRLQFRIRCRAGCRIPARLGRASQTQ